MFDFLKQVFKDRLTGFRLYMIPKGWHYSIGIRRIIPYHKPKSIIISFCIPITSKYDILDTPHRGINKIGGFSCGLDHHKTSFRIGWEPFSDSSYVIYKYAYKDGERIINVIQEVKYGDVIHTQIDDINFKWVWLLYPYMGGLSPSFKRTFIYLKFKIIK